MKPEDWECYLIKVGISANSAKIHAVTFVNKKLTRKSLQILDWSMVKELEALHILKQAKEATSGTENGAHYKQPSPIKENHSSCGRLHTCMSGVFACEIQNPEKNNLTIFTNPSAQAGYDTRSIFEQSLTGLNSEFSFS